MWGKSAKTYAAVIAQTLVRRGRVVGVTSSLSLQPPLRKSTGLKFTTNHESSRTVISTSYCTTSVTAMGIKHLYQLIQEHAPAAVKTGEIKNQFGRKVAIVRPL